MKNLRSYLVSLWIIISLSIVTAVVLISSNYYDAALPFVVMSGILYVMTKIHVEEKA